MMYFVNFLIILFLASVEINAKVVCNSTQERSTVKNIIKSAIKSSNTVFIVTDYSVSINATTNLGKKIGFLKFLDFPKRADALPLMIAEKKEMNTTFYDLTLFSNVMVNINGGKFFLNQAIINTNFEDEDKCLDNDTSSMIMFFDFGKPICIKLYACILSKNNHLTSSNKKIIYLMDSSMRGNNDEVKIPNDFERKFFIFDEFDEQGLCMCNLIDFYIEDCKGFSERNNNVWIHYLIVIGGLAVLILVWEGVAYYIKNA